MNKQKVWLSLFLVGSLCHASGYEDSAVDMELIAWYRQPWRKVQEKVKDTVVQIFVHVAEIDLLCPYETPTQKMICGSGFFINEDGDIITNAHVINQAVGIYIQIPTLGKRVIKAELVSICPERDIALLRLCPNDKAYIINTLGRVPFLTMGDSDLVQRADEVMALGYPLAQQALKSTTGVISGRERDMLQIDAAINPGSSGGPLLNMQGEVIGINTAGVVEAQNVGYAIPVNELKVVLPDMYTVRLLRKPFLGLLTSNATENLTKYLGNPLPGGCYVVEVIKESPLYKAGVRRGDMIYEINGCPLDIYGEMTAPWCGDKISVIDYVARLKLNDEVCLVIYRSGERIEVTTKISHLEQPAIRKIYPGYEEIDYEIFGGMVVMQLTMNHIDQLIKHAPGLLRYTEVGKQSEPVLVITHIFHNSQLYNARVLSPGIVLHAINGVEVRTLEDFRQAARACAHQEHFVIHAKDTITQASDNLMVVLPLDTLLEEELHLARDYRYELSALANELIKLRY